MTASILVYVGTDAVGDGLIKLPFVRALRAAYPDARITWVAGKGGSVYAGILAPLVTGLIDEVIDHAGIGSRPVELLSRPLGGRGFDLILDTQRRGLTTLILKRIRHRRFISAAAGYCFSDVRPAETAKPLSMAAQLARLVELASGRPPGKTAPLPIDPAIEAEADRLLPPGPRYVGFAPGAGGRHKCWPLDRYLAVAAEMANEGMVPVILLGPAESDDWAGSIRAALPAARLPLQETDRPTPMLTIALGRRLAAAVANDSGTGHMLAAADIPLLSLFGPTPADKFAPVTAKPFVLQAQDFGAAAMEAIPVVAVTQALRRALVDNTQVCF
ncbi:glycosyltransferase family 9 protein [Magnetospirillum molischianum]|uniref:ADP-heptose:LPS heptosyltransferase n=1 Tax=Magnetospirillum molischianum DSM 120 TaxID=1150626 RepID=H8FSJ4_MAGML|nr:glycosyltransferase family 9 protein [Magnetospirillum molischianum]CCG41332.1 ADP-heptose:LPS heptosyltransferase [Magnetospirillum molischianum DSM 120]